MLDIKFVRENPDAVRENIRKKFQDGKLPLVTNGFSGSNGIMFLLTVIAALSRAVAISLPVA